MREIPELQILCLRAVGSQACSAEQTFAQLENGETSQASRLLRRFHRRPTEVPQNDDEETENIIEYDTVEYDNNVPLSRKPCIGPGSARRVNANEVDLNHPLIGCRMPISSPDDSSGRQKYMTVMQHGSPALDSLQLYIDSLVELGRMNDSRLGIRFFEEWKANVQLQSAPRTTTDDPQDVKLPDQVTKKRKRGNSGSNKVATPEIYAFGSLSLHNCTLSYDTLDAMIKSGMGPHLAVLDLTGVHGVTDEFTNKLFQPNVCPNLRRLSLKNCRKVSGKTLRLLPTACSDSLECLDIGGCFNISAPLDVLPVIDSLPKLSELHASGLQWDDSTLAILVDRKSDDTKTLKRKTNSDVTTMSPWQCLSLGFSIQFTQTVLRECLMQIADTLQSLALPFCETVVDNALLGIFGRNLPHIKYLDLRGNSSLNTVTGWYDGRVSADLSPSQELTILGRYTSLTEASIEETRRVHPHAVTTLTVILDGGGMGAGIAREYL